MQRGIFARTACWKNAPWHLPVLQGALARLPIDATEPALALAMPALLCMTTHSRRHAEGNFCEDSVLEKCPVASACFARGSCPPTNRCHGACSRFGHARAPLHDDSQQASCRGEFLRGQRIGKMPRGICLFCEGLLPAYQ